MTPASPDGSTAASPDHLGPARSAAGTAPPTVTTVAQGRALADVLAWGEPRPIAPERFATRLRERLEAGLRAIGPSLPHLARARRGGRIVVSRSLLQRGVCQGWQLAPEPYVHTAANVRGVLGRAAILADLRDGRRLDPAATASAGWDRLASERPGDPRSLSAWMNRTDASQRTALLAEVADLVGAVREVWPVLPSDRVHVSVDVPQRIVLVGGAVELATRVDLAVDSRVEDGRARRLVVDLRTGQPRAPLDQLALRFAALCSTLVEDEPPFRWSTFYVTEGRFVSEDLPVDRGPDPLDRVVDQVVAAVADVVALDELAPDAPETALRLAAGSWCASCRRRTDCSVADAATDTGSRPSG